MQKLIGFNLVYLATPYTNFPLGRWAAFQQANALASRLVAHGIDLFCPVTHGHPLSEGRWGGHLDPEDQELWDRLHAPYLRLCDAIAVGMLESWETSRGVTHEIAEFQKQDKPVFYIEPKSLAMIERASA